MISHSRFIIQPWNRVVIALCITVAKWRNSSEHRSLYTLQNSSWSHNDQTRDEMILYMIFMCWVFFCTQAVGWGQIHTFQTDKEFSECVAFCSSELEAPSDRLGHQVFTIHECKFEKENGINFGNFRDTRWEWSTVRLSAFNCSADFPLAGLIEGLNKLPEDLTYYLQTEALLETSNNFFLELKSTDVTCNYT